MEYKNTLFRGFLILVLISSFLLPPNEARAQQILGTGVGLNYESIPQIISYILKQVGKNIAKKLVDDMVQSTIRWANTGFNGNPAYPTNWGRDLENIAKGEVGEYLSNDPATSFLCEPFAAQIKLSLVKEHAPPQNQYGCSLDDIGGNIDSFYQGQFKEGGWDAWLKVSQTSTNNPFGAYVTIKGDLDRKLQERLGLKNNERSLNRGFLGYKDCLRRNVVPPASTVALYEAASAADKQKILKGLMVTVDGRTVLIPKGSWVPGKDDGACLEEGPVKTPGSVVAAQLDNSLYSGLKGLIEADDIDALVSAFANGLLQRYVFSDKGLISDTSSAARNNELIDLDGDRIPDGYDYENPGQEGYGELNTCAHGLKDTTKKPSNDNCILSKNAVNSPYFSQICKASSETEIELTKFQKFLEQNPTWDPNYYRTWFSRTTEAQSVVERYVSSLLRFENVEFIKIGNDFGLYADYLSKIVESLARDKDMRNRGLPSNDNDTIHQTTQANLQRLNYISKFVDTIGQCDTPDIDALSKLPIAPPIGSSSPTLSCSASATVVPTNQIVIWSIQSSLPEGGKYKWEGDDINVAETDTPQDLSIAYVSQGEKAASITYTSGTSTPITTFCGNTVTVSDSGRF